jgi:transposase
MTVRRKYPEELREHAVRMVLELRRQNGSRGGEIARVGRGLGIHPESLRIWVRQREATQAGAIASAHSARIAALEREVRELRQAIETLGAAIGGDVSAVTLALCIASFRPSATMPAPSPTPVPRG